MDEIFGFIDDRISTPYVSKLFADEASEDRGLALNHKSLKVNNL